MLCLLHISCSGDSDDTPVTMRRTVLIYMSSENNLDSQNFLGGDLNEIIRGAKALPNDVNLLVYVDRLSTKEKPYIARYDSEGKHIVKQYDTDFYSSNPDNMKNVMQWVFNNYRAESYGLVFWGHGDGWIIKPPYEAFAKKAYSYGHDSGTDHNGTGAKWININTLNEVLATLPHLDYIFFDCCYMQCVEVAYELRNNCDYIIASPAEIPGSGAPYHMMLPKLFAEKSIVGKSIVDTYINYTDFGNVSGLPMSVVKTSNMEAFAQTTKNAVNSIMENYTKATDISISGLIYYYLDYLSSEAPMMIDMRDFMKHYLSASEFATWDNALRQTITYSVHPDDIHKTGKDDWLTSTYMNFYDFYLTDENYGGISMFIPQTVYSYVLFPNIDPNDSYYVLQWAKVVDWSK